MRIAITGGTGFVGSNLAAALAGAGHVPVLIARHARPGSGFLTHTIGLDDPALLANAFAGCEAVAHCAGINRETGSQTYQRVHVEGTRHVVAAAKAAGVKRIALTSFLRARPDCASPYHESKWAAEELVRHSGLTFTILKAGVIYGKGDHMVDHLTRAFLTFPLFGLVGYGAPRVRPAAVADVVKILLAALVDGRLAGKSVAVLGPDEMTLPQAVRRVAEVVGKVPPMLRLPVSFHYGLAWVAEKVMTTPMTSLAQVRMLTEGVVDPLPWADELPDELKPATPFSDATIRAALPPLKRFGAGDLLCARRAGRRGPKPQPLGG
jgi:nucleoside-diphosphate-sugar epimerase